MESKQVQAWFFIALLVLLFLVVARIFAPFFTVILWSTLLYVLISPLYHRMSRKLEVERQPQRALRALLAGTFSVGSVILVALPLSYVVVQLALQVSTFIRSGLAFIDAHPGFFELRAEGISQFLRELSFGAVDLSSLDLRERLATTLNLGVDAMVRITTLFVKNVGLFLGGLAFMTFTLFFFYMDGDYLLRLFTRAVPIRSEYMRELVTKFRDITRSLFLGYILVAAVQAVVAYIVFLIFRIEGSLAFGILLFFCSFIPMIGAGAVWGPIGLAIILSGNLGRGLLFLGICAVFVSTLDNFLRPFFLKDRIKLHPLVIFFSIVGGVAAFGYNGLILGPMAVILFLTVLDLFLTEHGMEEER